MWAATMTRPDISSAARTVAKFCENPGKKHWRAVVKILQCLRRTQDLGITYGGRECCGTEMNAYADSDYATCRDSR